MLLSLYSFFALTTKFVVSEDRGEVVSKPALFYLLPEEEVS